MATIKLLSYNPYQPVGSEEPDEALVVVAVAVAIAPSCRYDFIRSVYNYIIQ